MAFLIFEKFADNCENTLFKIAENQIDLDNICFANYYKIIEVDQSVFNDVKFGFKTAHKYINNDVTYINYQPSFLKKEHLNNYITIVKNLIDLALKNYPENPQKNNWNNYLNQLNSLNLDTIQYPLNKSLEKYFNDLGQTSFHPLQLP